MSLGFLDQWFHKCKKCGEILYMWNESEIHDCSNFDGSSISSNSSLGFLSEYFDRCAECKDVEHSDYLLYCQQCQRNICDHCFTRDKCEICERQICENCSLGEIIENCQSCNKWFCKNCLPFFECPWCENTYCPDCFNNENCNFCFKSCLLIQTRWRFVRMIRAASFIQLRWRFITARPSHPLCIKRLKNEWIKLSTS